MLRSAHLAFIAVAAGCHGHADIGLRAMPVTLYADGDHPGFRAGLSAGGGTGHPESGSGSVGVSLRSDLDLGARGDRNVLAWRLTPGIVRLPVNWSGVGLHIGPTLGYAVSGEQGAAVYGGSIEVPYLWNFDNDGGVALGLGVELLSTSGFDDDAVAVTLGVTARLFHEVRSGGGGRCVWLPVPPFCWPTRI